jgi:hypothetical protein
MLCFMPQEKIIQTSVTTITARDDPTHYRGDDRVGGRYVPAFALSLHYAIRKSDRTLIVDE